MMDWFKKILYASWFIPGSLILCGGFWMGYYEHSSTELQQTENSFQRQNRSVYSEGNTETRHKFAVSYEMKDTQSPPLSIPKENLYPNGNPPYVDILSLADAKYGKHKKILKVNTQKDISLKNELDALKLDKNNQKELPTSLKNPEKQRQAVKMLTDTYKVFDEHIDIATQVVNDAVANGSRTEDEINEALEAIEQMKRGRRMVIDKIQILENAHDTEENESTENAEDTLYSE